MNSIALIQRLHQHRAWVNDNLLTAAAALTDEQVRRALPIGQGSIWHSLLHLYAAEYVWLSALQGKEEAVTPGDLPGKIPGNQQGEGAIKSLPELSRLWSTLKQGWDSYLSALTPESLDELVYRKRSGATGVNRFATRRADVLLHVCTHAQYTTAQVVNMLRQVGVGKLPETMLIAMARKENQPG